MPLSDFLGGLGAALEKPGVQAALMSAGGAISGNQAAMAPLVQMAKGRAYEDYLKKLIEYLGDPNSAIESLNISPDGKISVKGGSILGTAKAGTKASGQGLSPFDLSPRVGQSLGPSAFGLSPSEISNAWRMALGVTGQERVPVEVGGQVLRLPPAQAATILSEQERQKTVPMKIGNEVVQVPASEAWDARLRLEDMKRRWARAGTGKEQPTIPVDIGGRVVDLPPTEAARTLLQLQKSGKEEELVDLKIDGEVTKVPKSKYADYLIKLKELEALAEDKQRAEERKAEKSLKSEKEAVEKQRKKGIESLKTDIATRLTPDKVLGPAWDLPGGASNAFSTWFNRVKLQAKIRGIPADSVRLARDEDTGSLVVVVLTDGEPEIIGHVPDALVGK